MLLCAQTILTDMTSHYFARKTAVRKHLSGHACIDMAKRSRDINQEKQKTLSHLQRKRKAPKTTILLSHHFSFGPHQRWTLRLITITLRVSQTWELVHSMHTGRNSRCRNFQTLQRPEPCPTEMSILMQKGQTKCNGLNMQNHMSIDEILQGSWRALKPKY